MISQLLGQEQNRQNLSQEISKHEHEYIHSDQPYNQPSLNQSSI